MVPELLVASVPFQPSLPLPFPAVHEVALAVDHDNETVCPAWTVLGEAVKATIDAGGVAVATDTETLAGGLAPPGPLQVMVYVYVPATLMGPILKPLLLTAMEPFQPSPPDPPLATQDVALAVDQVSE